MHKSGGRITSHPLSAPPTRRHPEWQEHTKHMKIPSSVPGGTPRAIVMLRAFISFTRELLDSIPAARI